MRLRNGGTLSYSFRFPLPRQTIGKRIQLSLQSVSCSVIALQHSPLNLQDGQGGAYDALSAMGFYGQSDSSHAPMAKPSILGDNDMKSGVGRMVAGSASAALEESPGSTGQGAG